MSCVFKMTVICVPQDIKSNPKTQHVLKAVPYVHLAKINTKKEK